jgi:hypothetical protein
MINLYDSDLQTSNECWTDVQTDWWH